MSPTRLYFLLRFGKLKTTYLGGVNIKKMGLLLRFKNGQKSYTVNFKGGKEEGLATWWHENGQKSFKANYKDGELVEIVE